MTIWKQGYVQMSNLNVQTSRDGTEAAAVLRPADGGRRQREIQVRGEMHTSRGAGTRCPDTVSVALYWGIWCLLLTR